MLPPRREGFQLEGAGISTARKLKLIDRLSATGLQQIQLVSFVNPKRVPGMADADQVVRQYQRHAGVRYTALWLNEQGFRRALASERLDLTGRIVLCASPAFLRRNQNMTPEENIESHRQQVRTYIDNGVPVEHGGLQAAFGCNFEGDIPVRQLLASAVRKRFDELMMRPSPMSPAGFGTFIRQEQARYGDVMARFGGFTQGTR